MRLFRVLCARTKFWDRYVSRIRDSTSSHSRYDAIRGTRTIKQEEFHYDENRAWTDGFKQNNIPGDKIKQVLVEPLGEWDIYKGDRVEITIGKDKGKQGLVNSVIKERNWVFVEGLNCDFEVDQRIPGLPPTCTKRERPLLVTNQVKLVDPSDELTTEVEWRFTEEGERVRVGVRTGRIVPLPAGATEVDNYVIPSAYLENDVKDTVEDEVVKITFKPKLCSFEQEIDQELGIEDDREPAKTYWY